jgi:hypothetical protein
MRRLDSLTTALVLLDALIDGICGAVPTHPLQALMPMTAPWTSRQTQLGALPHGLTDRLKRTKAWSDAGFPSSGKTSADAART